MNRAATENRSDRVFYQPEDGKLPVVVGQLQPTPRHLGEGLAVIRRRGMDITVPVDALRYADTGQPVPESAFGRVGTLGVWQVPDNLFDVEVWKDAAA
ncbi:hypothetical protein [Rhodococcoides fascians]|uniref:hypothetical protein n=1 Tax=Rhodococcoides fascians TaxID=1828 RepID=UPI00055A48CD|nr:hypothetical protein [Rhodococcus fascians]